MADKEKIIIEEGMVCVTRERIVSRVTIEEFIGNLKENLDIDTGILPKNCLFMKSKNGRIVYVVEISSRMIPLKFRNNDGNVTVYPVSIPFTQFYISCNSAGIIYNVRISCTKTPLQSIDEEIFAAPYPNIHDSGTGNLCTGTMEVSEKLPLNIKINTIINNFFTSNFNSDLSVAKPAQLRKRDESIEQYIQRWEAASKEDRFCTSNFTYANYGVSIQDIINSMLRGG